MMLVLISPPSVDPRESGILAALAKEGLSRYHVRKPDWSPSELEAWLHSLPEDLYSKIVLHHHHGLVDKLGLGGRHWPDTPEAPAQPGRTGLTSRSCHDAPTLHASLGRYDSVFFGPIFPSISKPGYGPLPSEPLALERNGTRILAVGGVSDENLALCKEQGFDGAAVLGAVWNSPDPLATWIRIQAAATSLSSDRHAA